MLIYLSETTARTAYTFDQVFKNMLGLEYRITSNKAEFQSYAGPKVNYSSAPFENEFFIRSSGLLYQKTIEPLRIDVSKLNDTIILYTQNCDLGFDIFAATFFMISRYEEYLPHATDQHGRLKATASIAFKNDFLQKPIVNIWAEILKTELKTKFPEIKFKEHTFKKLLTYDIDIAYQYKGRSFIRNIGANLKDVLKGDLKNILFRKAVWLGAKKDPWDVYKELENTLSNQDHKPLFFFLVGDYGEFDKNISYKKSIFKKLVKHIAHFADIGIHPSYTSGKDGNKIIKEKQRLEKILQKTVTKSRQHFLRFFLPQTYQNLLSAEIKEDYSMAFADMPGFRAGICTPFYFYDLKNEKQTELKIFPVTCMESSLIHYMKISPQEGLEIISDLINEVKKVNGTFISIWHNHTISETKTYKDWKIVHDQMLQKLSALS